MRVLQWGDVPPCLPPSISQPKLGDVVAPGPDFDGDKAWAQGRVVEEDGHPTEPFQVDWRPSGPEGKWHTFTADVCSLVVVACAEVVRAPHSHPQRQAFSDAHP